MTGPSSGEPAEQVRLTVAPALFSQWCVRPPGDGIANGFNLPPPLPPASEEEAVLPPAAAAVLTTVGQARRLVSLELTDAGLRLVVHACRGAGLDAVLIRIGYRDESRSLDWVQLALLPQGAAAEELLSWLPEPNTGSPQDPVPGGHARITLTRREAGAPVRRTLLQQWTPGTGPQPPRDPLLRQLTEQLTEHLTEQLTEPPAEQPGEQPDENGGAAGA